MYSVGCLFIASSPTAEKVIPYALLGMTAVTGLVDAKTRKETVMQHVHHHGILDPKGLLTPGSVLSAILICGIVVLLAGQSAYTQVGQEANKVRVGATAYGDWHNDAPGVRRLITAQDLPEIGKEEPSF